MVSREDAYRLLAEHDQAVTCYAWHCCNHAPGDTELLEQAMRDKFSALFIALTGVTPSQDDLDSITA